MSTTRSVTDPNQIVYHGGPVFTQPAHLYYIWYGNWSGNSATSILKTLAESLGGSPLLRTDTTYYYKTTRSPATGMVNYMGSVNDLYSQGKSLTDASVQAVVRSVIASHALGAPDPNGVYFVLASADVDETSGFCTLYCGWHTFSTIAGSNIKYAFVGNSDRCPAACAAQTTSPNGNAGADGMASIIAHELNEAIATRT